jgi:myb proto-oncogene protein
MEVSLEFSNNAVNSMQGMQGFMSSRRVRRKDQIFQIVKIKNKKKWTKEEDNILIRLAESHREKHWKDISKHFVNKNALQCFSRYKRIRPGIVKGAWGREEDEKIMRLVQIYGKSWSKISKVLVTRNGKQIRDRFINVLDPEIKKGKFTEEEDKTLIALYMHYGPKWATIAKHFLNRTADMIKNRFHSSIKKMFYNTPSNTIKRSAFLGKVFICF